MTLVFIQLRSPPWKNLLKSSPTNQIYKKIFFHLYQEGRVENQILTYIQVPKIPSSFSPPGKSNFIYHSLKACFTSQST